MPIEHGLRMFNSEKFVPIIMQQNPNLRGKTVGQVMGSLREKMGEGQVSLAEGGIARLNNGGIPRYQSRGLVTSDMTGMDVPVTTADPSRDAEIAEIRRQMAFEAALNTPPKPSNEEIRDRVANAYTTRPSENTPFLRPEDRPASVPLGEALRDYAYKIPKNVRNFLGVQPQETPTFLRPYTDSGMFSQMPPEATTTTKPPVAPAASTTSTTDNGMFTFPEGTSTAAPKSAPTSGGDTSGGGGGGGRGGDGGNNGTTGIGALTPRRSAFDDFAEEYKLSRAELKKQK